MSELKPCHWCEDDDAEVINVLAGPRKYSAKAVQCRTCGASGPVKDDEAEAITAWNTRPTPVGVSELAEMERLKKQLGIALEALEAIADGEGIAASLVIEIAQQALDDITRVGIEAIALRSMPEEGGEGD